MKESEKSSSKIEKNTRTVSGESSSSRRSFSSSTLSASLSWRWPWSLFLPLSSYFALHAQHLPQPNVFMSFWKCSPSLEHVVDGMSSMLLELLLLLLPLSSVYRCYRITKRAWFMNCANYYWLCGGIIITVYTREKRFLFLSYTQIHTFEEDI